MDYKNHHKCMANYIRRYDENGYVFEDGKNRFVRILVKRKILNT